MTQQISDATVTQTTNRNLLRSLALWMEPCCHGAEQGCASPIVTSYSDSDVERAVYDKRRHSHCSHCDSKTVAPPSGGSEGSPAMCVHTELKICGLSYQMLTRDIFIGGGGGRGGGISPP